jgi:hypothetical protein
MKTWQWLTVGGALFLFLRPGRARAASGAGMGAGGALNVSGTSGSSTVLAVARAIPDGGTYLISGTGVPFDVVHKEVVILAKGDTVYCSGFTFATVVRAAQQRGLLEKKSVPEVKTFQRNWYGAGGESEQLSGPALEKLGIGRRVSHDEAVPGDFLQIWRTGGSGHSTVFTGWLEKDGKRIGVKYRSAQGGGVGDKQERFSDSGGSVVRARTYFSRLA